MTDHTPSPATDYRKGDVAEVDGRRAVYMPTRWEWLDGTWTTIPMSIGPVLGNVYDLAAHPAPLADPAPEAAREVETTLAPIWGERPRTIHDGGLVGDDSPVRTIVGWQTLQREVGPWTPTPADLPVATGVTTEDEGCAAGHLEHGACACPVPAPVVSAGDEGLSATDDTEDEQ